MIELNICCSSCSILVVDRIHVSSGFSFAMILLFEAKVTDRDRLSFGRSDYRFPL